MRTFKKGEFVKLTVVGKVEENGKWYIYLSDGFKDTYRVRPMIFKLNGDIVNI